MWGFPVRVSICQGQDGRTWLKHFIILGKILIGPLLFFTAEFLALMGSSQLSLLWFALLKEADLHTPFNSWISCQAPAMITWLDSLPITVAHLSSEVRVCCSGQQEVLREKLSWALMPKGQWKVRHPGTTFYAPCTFEVLVLRLVKQHTANLDL